MIRLRLSSPPSSWMPTLALLLGATSWGILWYPFRVIEGGGLAAPLATFVAYLVAVLIGGFAFRRVWVEFLHHPKWLVAIGICAGITNVTYLVAIMQAEVVRIVLLFYLAPLWTVPLAHFILKERLTLTGYAVMLLAMSGAVVMLWRPELGLPQPRNVYEWMGLCAGFTFALSNVLVKGAGQVSPEAKSLSGCIGVLAVAFPVALLLAPPAFSPMQLPAMIAPHLLLLSVIGVVLISTSVALQYGLSHLSANRAAVIMLFELVVAAVAAHYLAGETTRLMDWIGGAMIVSAGMIATLAEHYADDNKN
ncbi:MAG: DMT family transporter [Betaproteobacteria bacterium]